MPTFRLRANELSGQTGLTVRIYALGSDTIANGAGGDSLTETASSDGQFTATIAETLSGAHEFFIYKSGSPIYRGNLNADGSVLIPDSIPIPPATTPSTCRVQLVAARNVTAEKVRVLIYSEGNAGRSGNNAFLNRAFDGETDVNGQLLVDLPWSSIPGVGRYRFKLFDLATGTLLHDRTCTVPNLSSAEYDDLT